MSFTVVWLEEAEDDFVRLWSSAAESNEIAHAGTEIHRLLTLDPLNAGESRDQSQRILFVPPLAVRFDVHPQDMLSPSTRHADCCLRRLVHSSRKIMTLQEHFTTALPYADFLAKYGSDEHRRRWADFHGRVKLTPEQTALLQSFTREVNVLVLVGAWCGDCVQQCPIFEHFAAVASVIKLRYIDRDADDALKAQLSIMGGARVPMVVFISEEGNEAGRFGDRTISKYRQLAKDQLGPSCPTGLVAPPDELIAAVTQDWLDIFERVHLMLRLSPRLREKHGD